MNALLVFIVYNMISKRDKSLFGLKSAIAQIHISTFPRPRKEKWKVTSIRLPPVGGYKDERTVKGTTCLWKLGEYPTVSVTQNYRNTVKMQEE